jgi:UDP-glucuronate 4-epimerase
MAPFLFTRAMLAGEPIKVFNFGDMRRDFTYIDDIVEGVVRVLDKTATPADSSAPYRIFNIGNHQPVPLMEFIGYLESALGVKAHKNLLPMQDGDVPATYADMDALNTWVGFTPATSIAQGVQQFVDWYRSYYAV